MKISKKATALDSPGITDWAENIISPCSIIDLSVGQPDFPPPVEAVEGLYFAALNGKNGYQDSQGIIELRTVLLNVHGISDNSSLDISITAGATAALFLALMTCFDEGDEILLCDPYFVQYLELIKIHNLTPVFMDTYPDFNMNLSVIEKYVTNNTKGVILNYPNNPTGKIVDDKEIEIIANYLQERGIYLIFDNIYSDFDYSSDYRTNKKKCNWIFSNNVIYISGFSKSLRITGWRIGYVIADKEIIHYITELQAQLYQGVSSVVQYGVLNAIKCDLSDIREDYKLRINYISEHLDESFVCSICEGGIFFFIGVPECIKMSATDFCKELLYNGVLVVPGRIFSKRDTHFRMSICKSLDDIVRAVDIINKVFWDIRTEQIKTKIETITNIRPELVGSYAMGINISGSDLDFAIGVEEETEFNHLHAVLSEAGMEYRGKRPSTLNSSRLLYSFYWNNIFVDLVILNRKDYEHLIVGVKRAKEEFTDKDKAEIKRMKKLYLNDSIDKYEQYKISIYKRFSPNLLWMTDIEICKYLIKQEYNEKKDYPKWLREKIIEYGLEVDNNE